jgi:hypothetical protein
MLIYQLEGCVAGEATAGSLKLSKQKIVLMFHTSRLVYTLCLVEYLGCLI